jgi:hypothetical protein
MKIYIMEEYKTFLGKKEVFKTDKYIEIPIEELFDKFMKLYRSDVLLIEDSLPPRPTRRIDETI